MDVVKTYKALKMDVPLRVSRYQDEDVTGYVVDHPALAGEWPFAETRAEVLREAKQAIIEKQAGVAQRIADYVKPQTFVVEGCAQGYVASCGLVERLGATRMEALVAAKNALANVRQGLTDAGLDVEWPAPHDEPAVMSAISVGDVARARDVQEFAEWLGFKWGKPAVCA